MKQALHKIYADPWVAKLYEWGKLFTITGFSQAVVQGIGFLSGIAIIRLLPPHEYGLYVVANTMVGTMIVLSDGGISTGVTSQGGVVWRNREQLGAVLSTALRLRKNFALVSFLVAAPIMVVLLQSHGTGWMMTSLLVLAIVPGFVNTLSGSLLEVAPRLHQDIIPLQKNQVITNCLRLVLSTLTLFLFPFAFLAILSSGIPQIWSNKRLKKISIVYADWSQKPQLHIRQRLLEFVRRLLPGGIYYCASGQISIWLISFFGSMTSVAEIGALTRFGMVLSLLTVLMNTLVVPRFARLPEDRSVVFGYYVKIQVLLLLVSGVVIFSSWLFAEELLWLLGSDYSDLRYELVLCMTGSCLNLFVGMSYILNSTRGWFLHPLVGILAGISSIIVGVLIIDVSTLRGVLLLNIFTGSVALLVHPLFGLLKVGIVQKQSR